MRSCIYSLFLFHAFTSIYNREVRSRTLYLWIFIQSEDSKRIFGKCILGKNISEKER
jgi:hypothetical protein